MLARRLGCRSRRMLFAFALLSILSACSSKKDIKPDDPLASAAASIPLEEKTTDGADTSVFADLDAAAPAAQSATLATDLSETKTEETTAPQQASAPEASPVYNTVGGESLGRVAYTLYGSRKYVPRLLTQNPELKGSKSLTQGQKIYFDFNSLNPQPMYLTKDLIQNYTVELAQHLEETPSAQQKDTVRLEPGQTLQALSQKLYGTTRYWTEIYLLNHDKLSQGYDKVAAGTELTVIKRDAAVANVSAPTIHKHLHSKPKMLEVPVPMEQVADVQMQQEEAAMAAAPVKAAPAVIVPNVTTQAIAPPAVIAPPAPPKVEGPVNNSPLPQMSTHNEAKPGMAKVTPASDGDIFNSTNTRRAIYVTLILGIALAAFYVTRPSKRSGFDMLDVTTHDSAPPPVKRPRLADRDDTNQNVG